MSRYDWVGGIVPEEILKAEADAETLGIGFIKVTHTLGQVIQYERIDPRNIYIRAPGLEEKAEIK